MFYQSRSFILKACWSTIHVAWQCGFQTKPDHIKRTPWCSFFTSNSYSCAVLYICSKKQFQSNFGNFSTLQKFLPFVVQRKALAVSYFFEIFQGTTSISDFFIPECKTPPKQGDDTIKRSRKLLPNWKSLIGRHKRFRVNFDMKIDLTGAAGNTIPRNMSRLMLYSDGKWQTGGRRRHVSLI
mgnify:CR=1 FL=1